MGVRPRTYDPLLDVVPADRFAGILRRLAAETAEAVAGSRAHDAFFGADGALPTRAVAGGAA